MKSILALASTVLAGCATLTEVNAGPVVAMPTKEDASVGGAVALHGAVGSSSVGAVSMLALDANAKMKVTSRTQNLAFGDGFLYGHTVGRKGEVLTRAGLQLVFERFDERLIVGGGPYAGLLGGYVLDEDVYDVPAHAFPHTRRDRTLLTFGPLAEIDARFSRPSAVAFVGIGIGLAWASEVTDTKPMRIDSPPREGFVPPPPLR